MADEFDQAEPARRAGAGPGQPRLHRPAPSRLWVADVTRIPCGQGVFWLAAVRDAFSNRIVGWRCSDRYHTDLILGALEYAVWTRDICDDTVVHHPDRGTSYTSLRFSQRLSDHRVLASMRSVGDSYDNALMENFFSTLNTERIQARLSWRSPDEYEAAWRARQHLVDDHPAADNTGAEPTPAR